MSTPKLGASLAIVFALHSTISLGGSDGPRYMNFTFETPVMQNGPTFSNYISVLCLRVRVLPNLPSLLVTWALLQPDEITLDQCTVNAQSRRVWTPRYFVNFLLGIVIIYNHKNAAAAVWSQLLMVYSLLIGAAIAIGTGSLSRFHSGMTVFLVMSPLSSTLVCYAVLGFCGKSHRLDSILSKSREHLLPRILIIGYAPLSLALMLFTTLVNERYFTANPCEELVLTGATAAILLNFLFVPYVAVVVLILVLPDILTVIAAIIPFVVLVVALVGNIIRQRNVLEAQNPVLHFCGVFQVPMIYWIVVNELRLLGSPDNLFTPSFGQVLVFFAVLPPLREVLVMAPKMLKWFKNRITDLQAIPQRQSVQFEQGNSGNRFVQRAAQIRATRAIAEPLMA
ncbi:hypothetical protein C8J57DRAFT_1459058 [Mycena rebaudengoi]|nr:hypothetical protein C8J57DRAFT_1459058 [Mycena rebaudengoi]